jgi:ABC-type molybdate transport system substrate-binding protein
LQVVTRYATAVHATSANPAAAKALVELLVSPETFALLKARGFDVNP